MEKNGINNKLSNGTKTFGGVIAVVALIAGIYAMVEPMGQRIDFLERTITKVERAMIADDDRERNDLIELGEVRQKFVEIETQFEAATRRLVILEEWYSWWIKNVPEIDATQSERLKVLERDYLRRNNK